MSKTVNILGIEWRVGDVIAEHIIELEDDLQSERERIEDLEEINDSLVRHSNKRIATLGVELGNIQDDNVVLQNKNTSLNDTVRDLLSKCVTLEEDVRQRGALELDALGKIAGMEAEIKKLKDDIHYHKEMNSAVGDLFKKDEARIAGLEAALETKDPEQHLKQLLDVISSLRAELEKHQDFLIDIIKGYKKSKLPSIGFELERMVADVKITLPESEQSNE